MISFDQYLSERLAANTLILIFALTIVFHFMVLLGVLPFEMVWGGRLKNSSEMVAFETVSIGINLAMLALVSIFAGHLRLPLKPGFLKIAFWLMFVLFLLNTVGNIFSQNETEKLLFTPITLLLALLSLRLALSKKVE